MIEEKKLKSRSSNMELLRIFAMFAIVLYHIVYHCVRLQLTDTYSMSLMDNGLFNQPYFYKRIFLLIVISSFGQISNDIFLLISGYFMTVKGKNINLTKVAQKLLLQLGFASVSLMLMSNVVYKLLCDDALISMENFFNFNIRSWFIGYYFIVIVIAALFLNKFLLKLKKEEYVTFLVVIFAITQFTWSSGLLNGIGGNLNLLLTGIFLYSLGGFVRIYNPFEKIRGITLFLIIMALYAMMYISYYNITMTDIEFFFRDNPNGVFIQSFVYFDNSSLIVMMFATCIFEIFRRIKMPSIKIINFLGASTFMVYLIHDNPFFYSLWNMKDWITDLYAGSKVFIVEILKWGALTFFVGVALYVLYELCTIAFKKFKWIFISEK